VSRWIACAAFCLALATAPNALGANGTVAVNVSPFKPNPHHDHISALAVQPDGKILAAGSTYGGPALGTEFAVVRFNPDGTLDPTFGDDGTVVSHFIGGEGEDNASDLVIQPDGKIVISGRHTVYPESDLALARLHPDGTLDSSVDSDPTVEFGDEGIVTRSLRGALGNERLHGLDLDPITGDILAVGVVDFTDENETGARKTEYLVARYNSDGTPDADFSAGAPGLGPGIATGSFGGDLGYDDGLGLAIDSAGEIVIAGVTSNRDTNGDMALARLDGTTGALDSSFSQDGVVVMPRVGGGAAKEVRVQPDGAIVIGGNWTPGYFVAARFLPNGTLDTHANGGSGFGEDGTASYIAPIESATMSDMVLQPDGKILLVGTSQRNPHFPGGSEAALVRFNSDGSLDSDSPPNSDDRFLARFGFFAGGITDYDSGNAVALGASGDIFVGGATQSLIGLDFGLARLNSSGVLDSGFDGDTQSPNLQISGGPGAVTSDTTPTFTFASDEERRSDYCRLDGVDLYCLAAEGTYTTEPLADGPHVFGVRGVDWYSNRDATWDERSFVVDTGPPETEFKSTPRRKSTDRTPSFAYRSSEPGSTFRCRVDQRRWFDCEESVTLPRLEHGDHLFRVRAVDAAGVRDESPTLWRWTVQG
jgi:uncharacterized delta-60 repeat protein